MQTWPHRLQHSSLRPNTSKTSKLEKLQIMPAVHIWKVEIKSNKKTSINISELQPIAILF